MSEILPCLKQPFFIHSPGYKKIMFQQTKFASASARKIFDVSMLAAF